MWGTIGEFAKRFLESQGGLAVVLFTLLIIERLWGNRRYDKLFHRYDAARAGEIHRIAQEKRELWELLLGKRPSSAQLPLIADVVEDVEHENGSERQEGGDVDR